MPIDHGIPVHGQPSVLAWRSPDVQHAKLRALFICSFPIADHFNSLGVINKQDYARRHGWELHLSAENVDPSAIVRHRLEPPLIQIPSSIKQGPSMLCGTEQSSQACHHASCSCCAAPPVHGDIACGGRLPSALQGNFNKMAFIKKMLAITPRADAEWIWWTDADTLITDTPYEFPFHR